jgi:hypothetical protein
MNNRKPNEKTKKQGEEQGTTEKHNLATDMDAVGWGVFFIWIGIVLLLKIGTGVGLVGIGIILLGVQAARKYSGLKMERFWGVAGILFVVGGLLELSIKLPLMSILFIVAGLMILVPIVKHRYKYERTSH